MTLYLKIAAKESPRKVNNIPYESKKRVRNNFVCLVFPKTVFGEKR